MNRFIHNRRSASSAGLRRTGLRAGEVFKADVVDLTSSGHAVVEHPTGQRVFVAGAWLGETVEVRIDQVKSRYASAQLVTIIRPHASRRPSPCVYQGIGAGSCGGCPWMFVGYDAQLHAKQARVERALASWVDSGTEVRSIWGSPLTLGYRNRAQLKTDGRRVGFFAAGGHDLVDIHDCVVLNSHNREQLRALRARLPETQWQPRRKGEWNRLDIDDTMALNAKPSANRRQPFRQGNSEQNQRMQAWLAATVRHCQAREAIELFAGSGNFTRVLANAGVTRILAVEAVQEALAELAAANLPGVSTYGCDLFQADRLQRLLADYPHADLLLLDPPRDGLKSARDGFQPGPGLRDIVYISCDLATFCRDVDAFAARGFVLREVQPVDLFPQTPHVELLAHLRRRPA